MTLVKDEMTMPFKLNVKGSEIDQRSSKKPIAQICGRFFRGKKLLNLWQISNPGDVFTTTSSIATYF
jgi:hypothetical protein